MRLAVTLMAVAALGACVETGRAHAFPGPRVILSIIIDDMGYHDSQITNPRSPTPNLGSLARMGVVLTRHYAYAYCSPTRRSFLTGRFPVHISGTQADICSNWSPLGMAFLPERLKLANFTSHFVGKTNTGFQTTDHLPINRGFASHVGFLYGAEAYGGGLSPLLSRGHPDHGLGSGPAAHLGLPAEPDAQTHSGSPSAAAAAAPPAAVRGGAPLPSHRRGRPGECAPYSPECIPEADLAAHTSASWFDVDFWEDDHPAANVGAKITYSTNFYTDRAVRLIEEFAEVGGPATGRGLHVHLCYQAVHSPFTDVPEWERTNATYGDPVYTDMLVVMDAGVGNVTAALRAAGLWDTTLIVVFSDNGGPSWTKGGGPNNYPFRGTKESAWEGGTRVAAMVSGGFLPSDRRGTTSDAVMHVADWFGTLSALVGVPPSAPYRGHEIDSVNVWPMLLGQNVTNPRTYLPITEQSILYNGRYKFFSSTATPFGFNGWSLPSGELVNGSAPGCTRCLFDVVADPTERVEITAQHPDIVNLLEAKLTSYQYYTVEEMTAAELEPYECAPLKPNAPTWPGRWPWVVNASAPPPPPNVSQRVRFGNAGPHVAQVDQTEVEWPVGDAACNQVALVEAGAMYDAGAGISGISTFWVALGTNAPEWVDIGFCAPEIPLNLSGAAATSWMGDQVDNATGAPLAWVYRASGLFRTAAIPHSAGERYGARFSGGANVTALRHSATSLEFFVDGMSQGVITLPASAAIPNDAVGCIGMCAEHSGAPGLASLARTYPTLPAAIAGPCCRRKQP